MWMKIAPILLLTAISFTACLPIVEAESTLDRRKPIRRALAWLVKAVESKAWNEAKPSEPKGNGVGECEIGVLATAWLLKANPDFAEFDAKTRQRCHKMAERILQDEPYPYNGKHVLTDKQIAEQKDTRKKLINWLQGFAALYVYDLSIRDGKAHPALDRIARGFIERQNDEHGWQHGKGNMFVNDKGKPFYPNTLMATTNLALFAFGAAERMKTPVTEDAKYKKALHSGLELLRNGQGNDGGIPYARSKGPSSKETAGRTAAALLTLAVLRQGDSKAFQHAAAYLADHVDDIPYGHGSQPLHIALAGLGCYVASDEVWRRYDTKVLQLLLKAQRKDGSFGPIPDAEDLFPEDADPVAEVNPETGGYELFHAMFDTALYALGLSADQTALARQLRLEKTILPVKEK